jgi:hypothetical protein
MELLSGRCLVVRMLTRSIGTLLWGAMPRHLINRKEKRRSQLQANIPSSAAEEHSVNHHQRKVLHAIFAHPVNANLDLKDVMGMLTALGAQMDAKTKSRIGIMLNGQTTVLHLTQHSLLKSEVMQIRKFLESCGITAEAYPI